MRWTLNEDNLGKWIACLRIFFRYVGSVLSRTKVSSWRNFEIVFGGGKIISVVNGLDNRRVLIRCLFGMMVFWW